MPLHSGLSSSQEGAALQLTRIPSVFQPRHQAPAHLRYVVRPSSAAWWAPCPAHLQLCLGSRLSGRTKQLPAQHGTISVDRPGSGWRPPPWGWVPRAATQLAAAHASLTQLPPCCFSNPRLDPAATMEKIKEAFTGKSKEDRHVERETGHTAASMTPAHPTGATGTYAERGAYGAGGTEYTGGAAGGPAYGTAVRKGGRVAGAGWQGQGGRGQGEGRGLREQKQSKAGAHRPPLSRQRPSPTSSNSLCPPPPPPVPLPLQATGYTEGATGTGVTETRVGTVEVPVVQQVGG